MRYTTNNITARAIIRWSLYIIIASGVLIYFLFQGRFLITGPKIELSDTPAVLQTERTVRITGHAQNIVALTLNGKAIFVNNKGNFDELLVLPDGYTIMTIRAKDRYGRSTTLERSFIYNGST